MSNYCAGYRYEPGSAECEKAFPFNMLDWDSLHRHRDRSSEHPRAGMQWRKLARLDAATLVRIQAQAARLQESLTETDPTVGGSRP